MQRQSLQTQGLDLGVLFEFFGGWRGWFGFFKDNFRLFYYLSSLSKSFYRYSQANQYSRISIICKSLAN